MHNGSIAGKSTSTMHGYFQVMTIPVGVSPGRIKALAGGKAPKVRRYPTGCGSSRHVENIEIAFLPTMKIDRIP